MNERTNERTTHELRRCCCCVTAVDVTEGPTARLKVVFVLLAITAVHSAALRKVSQDVYTTAGRRSECPTSHGQWQSENKVVRASETTGPAESVRHFDCHDRNSHLHAMDEQAHRCVSTGSNGQKWSGLVCFWVAPPG